MVQLNDKQRYEIQILYELKYEIVEIAKKMQINRKTVYRWLNRYSKTDNMKRHEGSGRKPNDIDDKDLIIIDEIKKNNNTTIREIKNVFDDKNIKISIGTIHNKLVKNDFVYKNPINKPLLTNQHKINRLARAIKYKNFDRNNVIFSDETMKRMESYNKKAWTKNNENIINKTKKYPLKKIFGVAL